MWSSLCIKSIASPIAFPIASPYHIVDVFNRGVAIVTLALARIRTDTIVRAGGCFFWSESWRAFCCFRQLYLPRMQSGVAAASFVVVFAA